jgi:hypothetical protein
MNCARFDFFKPVCFSSDIDDLTHSNVPAVQQAYSLFTPGFSSGIGTLRSWVEFVFAQDVAVRLNSPHVPTTMEAFCRNSVLVSRGLIDPRHLEPAIRI